MLNETEIRERIQLHEKKREEAAAELSKGDLSASSQLIWSNSALASLRDVMEELGDDPDADPLGYYHRPKVACPNCGLQRRYHFSEVRQSLCCMQCARLLRKQ